MAVKIFFHACAINHYAQVTHELLQAIMLSGLYEEVQAIYCFVTGPDEVGVRALTNLLFEYGKKIHVVKISVDDRTFERFTLTNIHKYVEKDDRVLYIHTKGVTHTDAIKVANTSIWRRAITYHLIGKYKQCLNTLGPCDVVGALYNANPAPHFQGNFWWVTGAYFLTLPTTIGPGYLEPEVAFLFQNNPRYFSMAQVPRSINDLYKEPLHPRYYVDTPHQHLSLTSSQSSP